MPSRLSPAATLAALLALTLCLLALSAPARAAETATPAAGPVIAYVDTFAGWHIRSLFPLMQQEFQNAGATVYYLRPPLDNPDRLWEQISKFHTLILTSLDLPLAQPATLRRYLDAGGGVLLVDCRMKDLAKAFPGTGLEASDRGVRDPGTTFGAYWWTRQVTPDQLTAGVRSLSFPGAGDYERYGTPLISCSPEWRVLVRAEKTARIFSLELVHSSGMPEWKDTGANDAQPPLFAVRDLGKGRLAVLAAGPEFVLWNLGNPAFPQIFMKLGDGGDHPSDGFRLLLNSLRWLAEPALAGRQLGGYQPPAQEDTFAFPKEVALGPVPAEAAPPTEYRALFGLHSNLSDGQASVADYAKQARALGLAILVFTDPWEQFTEEKYARLRKECADASDAALRVLAGITYEDVSGIRWALFEPEFLPKPDYLEPGTKRVSKDGMYAWNASGPSFRLARMPLSVSKIKPDVRNLWWHHFLAPWEYQAGKLVTDNTAEYFKVLGNQQGLIPTAYSEIKSTADLAAAGATCFSVFHGATLAEAVKKIRPDFGPPWPVYTEDFSYVTQGPRLTQFTITSWNYGGQRVEYTAGVQYFQMRVSAASEVGLAELAVLDGNQRIYRRFLCGGAKAFSRAWIGLHDRQHLFVLRATDTAGHIAYSSPRIAFDNARGLYFCSDNQNSLGNQNTPFYHPGRHEFPGVSPNWIPSFYGWRGWDGMAGPVRQAYVTAPYASVGAVGERELQEGERYERPLEVALASYFCNVFRTKTTRVIAPFTDASYGASTGLPLRDTSLADQEYTAIIPSSRADCEYYWFHPELMSRALADYRASLALIEGTLRLKKDVTLTTTAQPLPVASVSAWGKGLDAFYLSLPGRGVLESYPFHGVEDALAPGAFATAGPMAGAPFLANLGATPLRIQSIPDAKPENVGGIVVGLAEPGAKLAAGTQLDFRLLTGFLAQGEQPGRTGADLTASLNLGGGTQGYPLKVTTGKLVDTRFFLTLAAQNGEVQFTAGPRKMYLDLPVRLQGITDNGCVAFYEKRLGHFIFVPTWQGDALFQIAIDEGVDLWAGNPVVADQPGLLLTLHDPGEGPASLDVHNPTDAALTATLTSPAHTPFFGGWSAKVTVPPGESVLVSVPRK